MLSHPTVVSVAQDVGRSPAQVVLRWALQQGVIVLPRSSSADHIAANLKLFDFNLTDAHMSSIMMMGLPGTASNGS